MEARRWKCALSASDNGVSSASSVHALPLLNWGPNQGFSLRPDSSDFGQIQSPYLGCHPAKGNVLIGREYRNLTDGLTLPSNFENISLPFLPTDAAGWTREPPLSEM
jgi:hypothetical protein